jgi:hypothetical protein
MKTVAVWTDSKGNINIEELRKAAEANKGQLGCPDGTVLCPVNLRSYNNALKIETTASGYHTFLFHFC